MRRFSAIIAVVFAAAFTQAGRAADMPIKAPPPPVAETPSWTGLYVGGTFGGVIGHSQHCDPPGSGFCSNKLDVNGIGGGPTVGYNWQAGNWIYGLETDFSFARVIGTTSTSLSFGCGGACFTDINWFGTARGRVGYSFGNWFPYLTGGAVYARFSPGVAAVPPFFGTDGVSEVRVDWTVGGGLEYAIPGSPRWSVKAEYLYFQMPDTFYDKARICGAMDCTAVHNSFNVFRVGANYRF